MKILYLSCHSILEFDELHMLTSLGHQVFSPGAYVEPADPGDASLRPGLSGIIQDPEDLQAYHAMPCPPNEDHKSHLTTEFVERFDAVIVMHMPKWIVEQWDILKRRPVVWRTIGQSIEPVERWLQPMRDDGLKIVRYSPKERGIPGFIGEDATIRFYKDPDEFGPWDGLKGKDKIEPAVITFNQHLRQRSRACNYDLWEKATGPFDRKLYGPGNEFVLGSYGKVPFEELKEAMRSHAVYFYTGTHPASYTLNFIEAMMSGIPIVAPGPQHGNDFKMFPDHDLYEVAELLELGCGIASDDVTTLQQSIRLFLKDHDRACTVSYLARKKAIATFGKDVIWPQWQSFLETLS